MQRVLKNVSLKYKNVISSLIWWKIWNAGREKLQQIFNPNSADLYPICLQNYLRTIILQKQNTKNLIQEWQALGKD
jgi:hypothetical protein